MSTVIENTKKELASFHFAFQISRTVVFEVNYYRLGNNIDKYFTTSAAEFNRPKTDFNQCGQAQESLLPNGSIARRFYNAVDKHHIKDIPKNVMKTYYLI